MAERGGVAQVQRQQQQGEAEHRVEASDGRAEVQHSEGEQDDGRSWTAADNYPHGSHPSGFTQHHPRRWLQRSKLSGCLSYRRLVHRVDRSIRRAYTILFFSPFHNSSTDVSTII